MIALAPNPFKAAIAAGTPQIGVWCMMPGAAHAEALATCGFDWMVIDTEHTAVELTTVLSMLQAVAPHPTHPLVRPGSNDPVEIKRILDIGARSIVVPQIQNAQEAARAVAAVRYPPAGIRGVAGMTRASCFGLIQDYTAHANAEICLIVQVETAAALQEIEAIAAVDGVDGIFIGPADLAASMGHPGRSDHPQVEAAIDDALRRIRTAGKPAGILLSDPARIQAAMAAGSVFTAVDVDLGIFLRAARATAQHWQDRVGGQT